METISNVAAAASKAIFGEQKTTENETAGQEPISGEQGRGTTNEPFDKGNAEDPITGDSTQRTDNLITDSAKYHTESATLSKDVVPPTIAGEPIEQSSTFAESTPDHNSSTTKTSEPLPFRPVGETNPSSYSTRDDSDNKETSGTVRTGAGLYTPDSGDRPQSDNTPSDTTRGPSTDTPSYTMPDYSTPNPHTSTDKTGIMSDRNLDPPKAHDVVPTSRASNPGGAPEAGAVPHVKHQGADAPNDVPTGEQEAAVKSKKDEAEEIMKTRDPNDHSGEPMKMHDGPEKPTTQEERRTSKTGNPGGQEHGKDPKGTGEEWVKTSGTAAEGGDFDATKPGAGREAERLLEEKGVKRSTAGATSNTSEASTAQPDAPEKVSMGEKIKNKLHIGHKHK